MPDETEQLIKPTMHHVNLKTTRLQEMIDWYGLVVGAKPNFQFPRWSVHFKRSSQPPYRALGRSWAFGRPAKIRPYRSSSHSL